MKFLVLQSKFSSALSIASRFVSSKAQLPILSNVYIRAQKDTLIIKATNLETSVALSVGGKIEEEGEITVPARNLYELVSNLSDDQLEITSAKENLNIKSSESNSTLQGINATDFPSIPESLLKTHISLPIDSFKDAINMVLFSTSTDETRPILTGVNFAFKDKLRIASTDGFRLSEKTIDATLDGEWGCIVPKGILTELNKINNEDKNISFSIDSDNNQIIFTIDNGIYSSRILSGEFPNYKNKIPTETATKINLDKADLEKAVKLAAVFAKDSSNIVRFIIKDKGIKIYSESSSSGKQETNIPASVQGEKNEIGFNYKFLVDIIKAVRGSSLQIGFNGPDDPVLFIDPNDDSFTHIIMPVKL